MKKNILLIFSLSYLNFNASAQIKTLIIDGQNNHDQWPKITYMLRSYLEETGLFEVDVNRTAFTNKGDEFLKEFKIEGMPRTESFGKNIADPNFSPKFSKYDLVICNFGWGAAPWPEKTKEALDKFVKKGGGFVVMHAADNAFPEWPEYNKMIGLGGWGDRTEKNGPYVYYTNDGELKRDTAVGKGGSHGSQHEFQIQIRDTEHPITKGMPLTWLHTKDELYDRLRGPAENMTVLATAYSSPKEKGTDRNEPMLIAIEYGNGRIFHTPMGHMDYSWECVGLITSFLRGSQWAATGKVTIPIPSNFPIEKISTKSFSN
jgi:type 1 glutamine amidotransferase